jgi:oxalate decarboxylase/phosphoglucose isomerase-like protein (cupin superfamily)
VLETSTPAGFGPPQHIHHTADEMFYVLGGRFQFLLGDDVFEAGPGSFVFVPRGRVHAPKVVGTEPGRTLVVFTPAGQEAAFEEFAALAARSDGAPPDEAEMQAIAARYESEFVGPPLQGT